MTVFTPLSADHVGALLNRHGLVLRDYQPISEGIENSNFSVSAVDADGAPRSLVLTVFEMLDANQLPWFIELLQGLGRRGLPVAAPLGGEQALMTVAGKPALLVPRLPGRHPLNPGAAHRAAIGDVLARLHQCPLPLNSRSPDPGQQLEDLLETQRDRLDADMRARVWSLLERWRESATPGVLCHGDLFRDNVLFEGDALSGVLDFYNAGQASAEYDIAIVMNDWCVVDGVPDEAWQDDLLAAYRRRRPLDRASVARLPMALAMAALRFWLSRLAAPVREDAIGQGGKDPGEYEALFRRRYAALGLA